MTGLGRRLARLEGGGGCDACRITKDTEFRIRLVGLPPKPGADPKTYAPPGEKPRETCPACGRTIPVIRMKGLSEKSRGPAPG